MQKRMLILIPDMRPIAEKPLCCLIEVKHQLQLAQ